MDNILCGWISRGAGNDAVDTLKRMASAGNDSSKHGLKHVTSSSAAIAGTSVGAFEDGRLLVGICGHPIFNDSALAERASRNGIASALAMAYVTHGRDAAKTLRGDFAFAILDQRGDGEAVLAIDRIGTRSLLYCPSRDGLVFGTTADMVNRHPAVSTEVDPQSLYNYVYFHVVPAPASIYRGQQRLLPGHQLYHAATAGGLTTAPYWTMEFKENLQEPFGELRKEFLRLLREAVGEAIVPGKTGTFLSGGTDSSTLAGMLGEITGEPARTYSIGFSAEGYDEMHFARIAAKHFATQHHEYYVTPADVVTAVPQIAAVHDQPFGNSSAIPAYYCAKLAREDGVETLLGGDGGDELFGGNERYAKQYMYSLYSNLPRVLRKTVIEPIAFMAPEIGPAAKVQRYIRHASMPMPARYDNYNLLGQLGASTIFTEGFLATIDQNLPLAEMTEVYNSACAHSMINRMLALDLKYTLADNDLPKVMRSCELAGVDVRFPMLNEALVMFSARLPPRLKLKGTRLRYFFKEALRGYLPGEIIRKEKHGFGLPFGTWLQTHQVLRQLVGDSLQDLKQRGIVRADFIDELLNTRVRHHASYYGAMAWVLMMLELWFRRSPPQRN